MAASVLGTSDTFLERSNSFNQVQMSSFESSVGKLFENIKQKTSSLETDVTLMDSENAITLVSTVETNITNETDKSTGNVLNARQNDMIFDENSSSSNSTSSSKSRKRKSENEILQQDLQAFGVVPIKHDQPNTLNGENNKDGTKKESPAFRLRPRRNVKCNYGSLSPIFMSPVKKSPKKLSASVAVETAKNLQAFLNVDDESIASVAPHFDEPKFLPEELKIQVPMVRSFEKSIVRELDISVFAELISPLELNPGQVYPNNYISLKIVERKPLKIVNLNIKSKQYNQIPMLELKVIDLNDRFELNHSKGIFDNPDIKQASKTTLSIYLFGTYAKLAQELIKDDDVLGIVKFRTASITNAGCSSAVENSPMHNLRKRISKGEEENSFIYPYSIVVDSLSDMEMISSAKCQIKKEKDDDEVLLLDQTDIELEKLFNNTSQLDELFETKWAPFLSFSQNWRAPDNPKDLNETLYIFQPCVPKFESASSTVKM